nr:MAG TPA: hypothetical protein [Caudoviricetes sp.]
MGVTIFRYSFYRRLRFRAQILVISLVSLKFE